MSLNLDISFWEKKYCSRDFVCLCRPIEQVRGGRTDEARGLLWLMEEEVLQPGASEESLLARLFSYYGPAEGEIKGESSTHHNESFPLYMA